MSVPLPGERVRVELGSMSSVNLRISENIWTTSQPGIRNVKNNFNRAIRLQTR